jgi:hypothetical protein
VGRIVSLDFAHNRATLGHRGATVAVDTTHLEQLPFALNSLVMFVGEVTAEAATGGRLLLVARVCRAVEGLSLDMWDKSVLLHRSFQQKLDAVVVAE